MQSVTVAIVGLGYWGPNLLRNFNANAQCTVKYGCDTKQELLDVQKRNYPAVEFVNNFETVLNDAEVDLVAIATPTASHFSLAKQALEAGKHVLLEKPMCSTAVEAKQLVELAEAKGVQLFVDHPFVFAPAVQKVAEYANSGDLGQLQYFESSRINLGIIQPDCNVLWDLAIHDLSILSTFIDLATAKEVSAYGSAHHGQQVEVAHLDILFESGFHAHIYTSWLSPVKLRKTVLAGTKAMVTFDDLEPSEKVRLYDKGVEGAANTPGDPFFPKYRSGDVLIPAIEQKETLGIEVANIVDSITNGTAPAVPGSSAAALLAILEAADESLAAKKTITL